MTNNNSEQLRNQAITVMENIEDTVEHICDAHLLSGEKVWCMIAALSDYKLAEFSDSPDIEYEEELDEEDNNEDWTNNIADEHFEEDD